MSDPAPGTIRFLPEDVSVPVAAGESILSHAIRAGGPLLSPCGGEKRCGQSHAAIAGRAEGGAKPGFPLG